MQQNGDVVRALAARVFGAGAACSIMPLTGGRTNTMFRVDAGAAGEFVLRLYARNGQRAEREIDAIGRVRGAVAVPDIVHADPSGSPPFIVYRYVAGWTLRDIRRGGDRRSIAAAAAAAGAALAAAGRIAYERGSPFRANARIMRRNGGSGEHRFSGFIALCAASPLAQRRIGSAAVDGLLRTVAAWEPRLSALIASRTLVHGDFSPANIVLKHAAAGWRVAAVLDWEFACAGSPLFDLGHILRYDDSRNPLFEPHLARGFLEAGGVLEADWRRLARVADLAGIAGGLTKPQLPPGAAAELRDLLDATLRACPAP